MSIEPGRMLAHYRIVEKIGEGGMGVVWKAVDTTLDREVAIKILPPTFADDPDRPRRFEREAKLLASLHHPNIAGIFGLHEADGVRFLAMELVEGEDLDQRLSRGPLRIADGLETSRQVALALEFAHDNGVIHRDLKPANVRITPRGQVKVLDFGLAKAFEPGPASGPRDLSRSPTVTADGTVVGVILGTAAYMSPEQARGKPVDKRSDNWSFGCVLWELLTGRRLFAGESVTDTFARILERTPDWSLLPPDTPDPVRRLLERCLAKDANHRLRNIGDARLELEQVIATHAWSGPAAERAAGVRNGDSTSARRAGMIATAAFVLGVLAGGLIWQVLTFGRSDRASRGPHRVSLRLPSDLNLKGGTLSPDGETWVIAASKEGQGDEAARRRVYRRGLDSFEFEPIEGTERVDSMSPALSPSGGWLAFTVTDSDRRQVKKISMRGGPPVTIWSGPPGEFGRFDWIDDGALLFESDRLELSSISADGGEPEVVSAADRAAAAGDLWSIDVIPGAEAAFLTVYAEGGEGFGAHVEFVSLSTGERKVVIDDGAWARFAAGHAVFSRRDTLLAAPFDPSTGELTGSVRPMLSGMWMFAVWTDSWFELSRNGDLLYAPGGDVTSGRRLVRVDRTGDVEPLSDNRRPFDGGLEVSPDGEQVAVHMSAANRSWQVWIHDIENDQLRRIHVPGKDCYAPLWAPDGRVAFVASASGAPQEIWLADSEGRGEFETIFRRPDEDPGLWLTSWSPDGSTLAITLEQDHRYTVQLLDVGEGELRAMFPDAAYSTDGAVFSPDGSRIAYHSDESGQYEIYVSDWPIRGTGVRVSRGGGTNPLWSPDGAELYYQSLGRDRLLSVRFDRGGARGASEPEPLFLLDRFEQVFTSYAITPEGEFIFIERGPNEQEIRSVNLILNWTDELR